MTASEFYRAVEGNYEEVRSRLLNEQIIVKFLNKFLNEPSYNELMVAVGLNDINEAIQTSHKLKGVVANLGLTSLCEAINLLLTDLRKEGQTEINRALLNDVSEKYNKVIALIAEVN